MPDFKDRALSVRPKWLGAVLIRLRTSRPRKGWGTYMVEIWDLTISLTKVSPQLR